jgi:hypothetical protein
MAKVSYWELINIVGNTKVEEFEKILSFIYIATKYVNQFFDVAISLNISTKENPSWDDNLVVFKTVEQYRLRNFIVSRVNEPIVEYHIHNIFIRYSNSAFGHYLSALTYGIISPMHKRKLREALAWYFTLKLTETSKYTRPQISSIVDYHNVSLVEKLALMIGVDFLKDFALGRADLDEDALPKDVQELISIG